MALLLHVVRIWNLHAIARGEGPICLLGVLRELWVVGGREGCAAGWVFVGDLGCGEY